MEYPRLHHFNDRMDESIQNVLSKSFLIADFRKEFVKALSLLRCQLRSWIKIHLHSKSSSR